jgi:DNA invertase Pin-like site-specific DNA recombinase
MNERSERIKDGMAAAAVGGRKAGRPRKVDDAMIREAIPLGTTRGAAKVGLCKTQFLARRRKLEASS